MPNDQFEIDKFVGYIIGVITFNLSVITTNAVKAMLADPRSQVSELLRQVAVKYSQAYDITMEKAIEALSIKVLGISAKKQKEYEDFFKRNKRGQMAVNARETRESLEKVEDYQTRMGRGGDVLDYIKHTQTRFRELLNADVSVNLQGSYIHNRQDFREKRYKFGEELTPEGHFVHKAIRLAEPELHEREYTELGIHGLGVGGRFTVNPADIRIANMDAITEQNFRDHYDKTIYPITEKVFRSAVYAFLTERAGIGKDSAKYVAESFFINLGAHPYAFAVESKNMMAILYHIGGYRASRGRYIEAINRRFSAEYLRAWDAGHTKKQVSLYGKHLAPERLQELATDKYRTAGMGVGKDPDDWWIGVFPSGKSKTGKIRGKYKPGDFVEAWPKAKGYIDYCVRATREYLNDLYERLNAEYHNVIAGVAVGSDFADSIYAGIDSHLRAGIRSGKVRVKGRKYGPKPGPYQMSMSIELEPLNHVIRNSLEVLADEINDLFDRLIRRHKAGWVSKYGKQKLGLKRIRQG